MASLYKAISCRYYVTETEPGRIIALCTITKKRFCYMITYETPRTDADKHFDQLKGNV